MKRSASSLLTSVDELFTTQQERDEAQLEKVQRIPLAELRPFKDHPFKVQNNEEMERIVESIRKVGVLSPGLARPMEDGGYELVSGHRRLAACQALGLEDMPVVIREMTDDEAVIAMVDANLQREHILPSEKAFAYYSVQQTAPAPTAVCRRHAADADQERQVARSAPGTLCDADTQAAVHGTGHAAHARRG